MKIAALLQKHHYRDPTLMKAADIFHMATKQGATLFQTGGGEIKVVQKGFYLPNKVKAVSCRGHSLQFISNICEILMAAVSPGKGSFPDANTHE